MLTNTQEINDMMLNRFSDPATLIAIGPNRVALFLERFPEESKARNLILPNPDTPDPGLLQNLALALAQRSIRDRLQTALNVIEAAAQPENHDFLSEVIQRRIPCVGMNPNCALDRALEIWFAARDELALFLMDKASQIEVGRVAEDSPDSDSGRAASPPSLTPRYPDTPAPLNHAPTLHAQRPVLQSAPLAPEAHLAKSVGDGGSTTPPSPALGEVLHNLTSQFRRLVILPKYAAETLALFTVHTYAFQLRDVSVYLGIESPEKGCGKTTPAHRPRPACP
jgi:hypothetical protein